VNTSLYEGFPNTFIQSWLRGVPVLSLTVNPDGVLDGETLGVHAGSPQRLAEQMRRLIRDREWHEGMSRGAARYAREFHSMRNADRLVEIIGGCTPAGGVS
jgi:glycosyltransferase involved in cell wall biosynthesis